MNIPDLSIRSTAPEKMDAPDCCEEQLARTIGQFKLINQLFSRYRTALKRHILRDMLHDRFRTYHLVDVGAGGGDIAAWLLAEASKLGLRLRVTAIDADPRIIGFARERYGDLPGLELSTMNAFDLNELESVDFLFANHFLHHLDDTDIVRMLQLAAEQVQRLALFTDLRRSYFSYYAFTLAATPLFRRSFAVEDGRLSIRKGFVPDDIAHLITEAGLTDRATIETLFPGRIHLLLDASTPRRIRA